MVRLIPPSLPIRLLARRPPDLPGASHGCPFPLPSLKRKEYTHGSTAVAGVAATRPVLMNQRFNATFVSATTDRVTVQGVGSIDGTPDVTILSLQVSVTRQTSGDALDAASAVVSKVLSSLRHHRVAAADVPV